MSSPVSNKGQPSLTLSRLSGQQELCGNPVPSLILEGNLAHNWSIWYQKFKIFLQASNLESESDSRKVAIFLRYVGEDALQVFNSFNLDMDNCQYLDVVNKFESHCKPKTNLTIERYNFLTRRQKPDESIEDFVTALKNLSLTCEFDNLRESLVRDMFIVGLSSNNKVIRARLLQEQGLNLTKAISIAKSIEITHRQAEQIEKNSDAQILKVEKFNHSNIRRGNLQNKATSSGRRTVIGGHRESSSSKFSRFRQTGQDNQLLCTRCGQVHRNKCPAINAVCKLCNKVGHYAKCCCTRQVKYVNVSDNRDHDSNKSDLFVIGSINSYNNRLSEPWILELKINNKVLECNLDTAAQANVMSLRNYKNLKIARKIQPTAVRLTSFSGNDIPVLGTVIVNGVINDNLSANIHFVITNTDSQTIIGLPTIQRLGLVKRVFKINNHESVLSQYKDVFKGLGCLPGEYEISVNKDIVPVIEPPRKIPFMLNERF
ncbi:uncharacterized protein [Centruroides vittatus]|uniref:uncharacterized protein n=1 Tax=Centruroides vittatus TaxID=120091 RepID=UPI00350F9F0E